MWSSNGNYVSICDKNGKLDIFDKNEKIFENIISDRNILIKNFDWLDEQNIVTVGWEKNEQKIKLWDLRNNSNCFEELIITNKNDNNDINLFINQEMKLIYTVRKEENIKSNPSMIVYNLNENKKFEKIYGHETDYLGFCTVLLKNNLTEKKIMKLIDSLDIVQKRIKFITYLLLVKMKLLYLTILNQYHHKRKIRLKKVKRIKII